jgi:mevalonate pyrophosphate decarboxylase
MEFVNNFNNINSDLLVAYTFDAGPNCFLIFEEKTFPKLYKSFKKYFNFKCLLNYDNDEFNEIKFEANLEGNNFLNKIMIN